MASSAATPPRWQLFGAPALEHGGGSIALPFERRGQLVALLALRRSWVGRAELAALLWPEQETRLAYANLRKTLFRLQSLPWAAAIESQGSALRLQADTDVGAFESALREARVDDALALRRGELLAGFDDDANDAWSGWLRFERDRLRAAWRGAALERLGGDVDPATGIELSARLLDADPLDEAALRAHLGLLAQAGQAGRARQAYRDFVTRLADELGLAPGAELQALHDTLAGAAARRATPAVPAITAAPDDGFVGRSVERWRIAELLSHDCRLLTLVGPGGVGKTRLAQRVLHELAPDYPDGTAFVALEDVASSSDLAARLARELGLAPGRRGEPLQQVIEALRGRRMLLVLDNFEQLAADAPLLETLLQACPGLALIVTSRVRLALAMEQLLPLEGLPCPEAEDEDRVEAFDAARLFVGAARRVEPALVPAAEAAAIVEICRQVEGLPLALELAAAWTRVLSCDAIAAELRQGIELLRAVDAAHPARHASIELVFEQSWRRLAPKEREALARLSVFRGGFTAEAARAVAGTPLAVLGALADKSLLRKDGTRLALHPLVQQLAAARLGEGEQRDATQAAHAAHFHRLLARLLPVSDSGGREFLQAVDIELDNCRRAWHWSVAHGPVEALTSSADTLHNHFDHRGRFAEALSLFRQALDGPLAQGDAALQALLLGKAAHFEYRLDRYADAEASAARALDAARRVRDRATQQRAEGVLAGCALQQGRLAEARGHYQRSLALSSAATQAHNRAATLDHLALIEKRLGHHDEALRLSIESLAEHRRLGDNAGVALCLNNLASHYLAQRQYEAAAPHLREGLAICERDGLTSTRGYILANLIEVDLHGGDIAGAQEHVRRALEIVQATGNRTLQCWVLFQRSRLATRGGDLAGARADLAEATRQVAARGLAMLKAGGVLGFADLLAAQGERAAARRVLAFGAAHPALAVPDRDELRVELERLGPPPGTDAPWPGIELDELLQRIVAEATVAHAPLIDQLRA